MGGGGGGGGGYAAPHVAVEPVVGRRGGGVEPGRFVGTVLRAVHVPDCCLHLGGQGGVLLLMRRADARAPTKRPKDDLAV